VILQSGNRALGKAHSPPFAGLGARTNYEAAPVLPAGEGSPYVQGGLNGVEVRVFPAQVTPLPVGRSEGRARTGPQASRRALPSETQHTLRG